MGEWLIPARCILFGVLNFIPSICANWWLVISPRILRNNLGVSDPQTIVNYTGLLYTAGLIGVILGSFLWPVVVKFFSKKVSIIVSNVLVGLSVFMMGVGNRFGMFFAFRIVQGASSNIHTVGKDFIFDYFPENLRQFVLNLDTVFSMVGNLLGPLLGIFLYRLNDESFSVSCMWIMIVAEVIALTAYIFFYVFDWKPVQMTIDIEERLRLLKVTPAEDMISARTLKEAALQVLKKPSARGLIVTFAISSACTAAELVISVLFLQASWNEGGLEISQVTISMIAAVSFFPSVTILFYSDRLIPHRISYRTTIAFFILTFASLVMLTPAFRDLIPREHYFPLIYLVYFAQCTKFSTNSHVFAPFIHYLLNRKLNKHIRTGINSINYFICMAFTIFMISVITEIYSWTMYSPFWAAHRVIGKYIAFWILGLAHIIPFFLLKHQESKKKSESSPTRLRHKRKISAHEVRTDSEKLARKKRKASAAIRHVSDGNVGP